MLFPRVRGFWHYIEPASSRRRRLARTLPAPLTIGVPRACAQCATPTAAPATYRGEVRNDTNTPLFVRFKHRRQCIAKAPPCFTSARSALLHRHRFSRTRYTPASTPRLPAAPTAAAAFTTWSCGNADRRREGGKARLSARTGARFRVCAFGDEKGGGNATRPRAHPRPRCTSPPPEASSRARA